MGIFGINTGEVHSQGVKISGYAEEFGVSRTKINDIVDKILASAYTSDDAKAIANKIKLSSVVLNQIQQRLEGHGEFGRYASMRTEQSQNDIISAMRNNQ